MSDPSPGCRELVSYRYIYIYIYIYNPICKSTEYIKHSSVNRWEGEKFDILIGEGNKIIIIASFVSISQEHVSPNLKARRW